MLKKIQGKQKRSNIWGKGLALIANKICDYNQNQCDTDFEGQVIYRIKNPEIDPNISDTLIYVNSSISLPWDK